MLKHGGCTELQWTPVRALNTEVSADIFGRGSQLTGYQPYLKLLTCLVTQATHQLLTVPMHQSLCVTGMQTCRGLDHHNTNSHHNPNFTPQ